MATWKKIAFFTDEVEVEEQEVVARLTGGDIDGVTIGIADNNMVQVDGTTNAPVNGDYAKWTANGLEGKAVSEVKTDLSLNLVENTAHSTDAHTMTIDGIDVSAHDVATTGVHGVGAYNIAKDLIPSTLTKYYLGTDQNDIVANANSMVQLDTVVVDAGSNFQTGDWYGAAGAYRQSDADSGANNIRDDDASFPATIHGALVKWASNAAGDTDTGVGYVTSVIAADDLYIVKTSGAAFAASYYYWIKKAYYVAPVTGYYAAFFQIQYKTGVEADKQYGVYAFVNGVYTIAALLHSSIASALRIPHNGVLSLTANDIVALYGFTNGTNATADIGSGEGNTVMSIFCLLEA